MGAGWIEVDRAGLAQVIADRPAGWLLYELIQNALDEAGVTTIDVEVTPAGRGRHIVTVTDDSTNGYADIRHAWTMFAPSGKKGNAEQRGRFNLGCKLVLALAVEAEIVSTESAVRFTADKGRQLTRRRRQQGTQFVGEFKLTLDQAAEAVEAAMKILPPEGVSITVNGSLIHPSRPVKVIEGVTLPTVIGDDEGVLRRTRRQTTVELHKPRGGETPMLYELGIPVVELTGGEAWHANVLQCVPLNTDRDNVTPGYLRALRVEMLNAAHDELTVEQATAVWATEASEDERASSAAVSSVLDRRFGEKRVAYDPSDREANSRAVAAGYTVVPGGSLTKGQWANARQSELIPAAGRVTPGHKVAFSADGVPPLRAGEWTDSMKAIAKSAHNLAQALCVASDLRVDWYQGREAATWRWQGAWQRGGFLKLNASRLGREMLDFQAGDDRAITRLLIHEFAHEKVENHLSDAFHEECTRLGVDLAYLAGQKIIELRGGAR